MFEMLFASIFWFILFPRGHYFLYQNVTYIPNSQSTSEAPEFFYLM